MAIRDFEIFPYAHKHGDPQFTDVLNCMANPKGKNRGWKCVMAILKEHGFYISLLLYKLLRSARMIALKWIAQISKRHMLEKTGHSGMSFSTKIH